MNLFTHNKVINIKTKEKMSCKTEEEVNQIVIELQNQNPNLSREEILKAIASCCVSLTIKKDHETFIGCVKERIRMLKIYE